MAELVQARAVARDAAAERAGQGLGAEADAEIGTPAVRPVPDPLDLVADVGPGRGVVHALGAAIADHRGIVAVGRRQPVAAPRRAPLQAVAHLLKLGRGAVVALPDRVVEQQNGRVHDGPGLETVRPTARPAQHAVLARTAWAA